MYAPAPMSFMETVERARALLQRNGRISLRALAVEYGLGENVDVLVEELVEVQQVARRDGNVLVWVGDGAPKPAAAGPPAAAPALDRLAHHYARLTEGQGRGPAREAKAALDELAARLDAGTPG